MNAQRVLFLCTHNSARSQIAEGLLRARGGDRYQAFSAGSEATAVRPEAIAVMAELGIDISSQESKPLDRFFGQSFDLVITVCDFNQGESCPVFAGAAQTLRWDVEDPSSAAGPTSERMAVFRRVRDELDRRIRELAVSRE
jgi:arsenate reductase